MLSVFSIIPANAQLVSSNVWITTDDSVHLEATIRVPVGAPPAGGYPGVVLVHGYGGNKDESYIIQVANILALNGYASLAYSVRGQGRSEGFSTTMGVRERTDLLEVIDYFRATPGIDSTRLAVVGGSQGGIHSWMAAVFNMPGVRVIAPSLATPHFALDLIPHGCVKTGLYHEMTLGSVRYAAERDRVKDFIISDMYDSVETYVAERDLERYTDSVRIPVIQGLGWADVLFPVNSGIRAAANLSSRNVPVWSYYGTNGHGEPADRGELLFYITTAITWFNHFLKDSTLEGATVPRTFYSDDRPSWPHHITDVWPPQPHSDLRLYLSRGMLTAAPAPSDDSVSFALAYDPTYSPATGWTDGYSGAAFIAGFRNTPVRFISGAVADSLEVTGAPTVHLFLSSASPEYQAHTRLFDVEPSDTGYVWRFVGRGTYGVRNSASPLPVSAEYECNALSHVFPAGHRIGVEITSLDMFPGDSAAYTIPYFHSTTAELHTGPDFASSIDLPLIGTGSITSISQPPAPSSFVLNQNYPNPFNASTVISFTLDAPSGVMLDVFDVLGRKVASPLHASLGTGGHTVRFDGSDFPSGVYFYRLTTGRVATTRTMVLLK